MKRLVHLTTSDISLDWLLRPQLEAFAAAGYEVIGASGAGPHVASIEQAGIRHESVLHATRSMAPGHDLLALGELVGLFRRLQPDIVHTHNPKPGIYGRVAAKLAGVPVIVNTVHGLYATPDDRWSKRAVVYGLERLASLASGAELVQCSEDVDTLLRLGVPASKVCYLGNGIDLDRFDRRRGAETRAETRRVLGLAETDVVCGLVGRLVWEKGYAEVFAAATYLRRLHPEVRFLVVGPSDPGKADAVGAEALETAEATGIRFLGPRTDVEALYAAMDLYVLASHREGFPRSAMEAAAMGLPLVVTDIRGCREVVDHDINGLLVPPRDPVGLAEAIASLASDPVRRARMGKAGQAKAQRDFDQQRVIDRTLDTYDRLLAASSR